MLKSRDFARVARQSTRHVGNFLVIFVRKTSFPSKRLGITVSRRYGKAHERNRFKRLVRESFRLAQHQLPEGVDLSVKPRSAAKHATLQEIREELVSLVINKPS